MIELGRERRVSDTYGVGLRERWRERAQASSDQRERRLQSQMAEWADPPRNVNWHMGTQPYRQELFGPGSALLMTYKPGTGIVDPAGRPLARVRQHLVGGEARSWRVTDATGIAIADVVLQRLPDCTVTLLPSGPVSDRISGNLLAADRLAQLRDANPLTHHLVSSGEAVLTDASGRVLARERSDDLNNILDPSGHSLRPWSIEVEDNFLPASWLFAVTQTCATARGALGRH